MGLFKRRTTQSVGKEIGESIERQKVKEKTLRTLQKEKEERDKERELNEKIKKLKEERPSFFKNVVKCTNKFATRIDKAASKSNTKQKRRKKTNDLLPPLRLDFGI